MELYRGILFIRLNGNLNEKTVKTLNREVTNLVLNTGIKNLVFNITELENIDLIGIDALYNNYRICKCNQGEGLLCGVDSSKVKKQLTKSSLLKYIHTIENEHSALEIFNI